ncbi:glycosyltransferase family 39 protein [Bacteroides sp. Ga6A2]|uniref:glycosyltransferase family 39 protein n=2 Tax=unclassified Bacteroides TaxID=2646097 RepID=UPI0004E11548|nr:glycosyltransferase family 39 protein [Bacteroides sp. Ga6A2]
MTVFKRFIEQNYFLIFVFALIFLFKIVMLPYWKICGDSIYYILSYKLFLNNADAMPFTQNFYMANLLGHVFLSVWNENELLGLRFLQVCSDTIMLLGLCLLYKNIMTNKILMLSLLIPVVCFYDRQMEFYYDSLSVTFAVWILYFFVNGFEKGSYRKIAISGFLVGINIFVRTPNLVYLGLGFLLVLFCFFCKKSIRKHLQAFFCGTLVGVFVVIMLMLSLGHFGAYIVGLKSLAGVAESGAESHNMASMILVVLYFLKMTVIYGGALGLFWVLLRFIDVRFKSYSNWLLVSFFGASVLFLFYGVRWIVFLYSVHVLALLCYLYRNRDLKSAFVCLSIIYMIFVIPLGSDMYLETVGYYALYLSTPLVVYVIVNEIRRYNLMSAKLFCLLFFLLFVYRVGDNIQNTVSGKQYEIDNKTIGGIKITKEQFKQYSELNTISQYIDKDKCLAVPSTSDLYIVNYASVSPFVLRVRNWHSADRVYNEMQKAYARNKQLPIVIVEHYSSDAENSELRFVKSYNDSYYLVYKSEAYSVYKPVKGK